MDLSKFESIAKLANTRNQKSEIMNDSDLSQSDFSDLISWFGNASWLLDKGLEEIRQTYKSGLTKVNGGFNPKLISWIDRSKLEISKPKNDYIFTLRNSDGKEEDFTQESFLRWILKLNRNFYVILSAFNKTIKHHLPENQRLRAIVDSNDDVLTSLRELTKSNKIEMNELNERIHDMELDRKRKSKLLFRSMLMVLTLFIYSGTVTHLYVKSSNFSFSNLITEMRLLLS